MSLPEITVQELKALQDSKADFLILDVRNADEYAFCNLGGLLIPMSELPAKADTLNKDQKIIIHCHAGGRSRRATEFLQGLGFGKVYNLRGGITAWANEIDPQMPTY